MQGRKLTSTIFILFFIGSIAANEQLKTQLENSDNLVSNKLFQLLLLIPTDAKMELKDSHENHIEVEEKVHHSDLISTFLEEFQSNGGQASNVDALLKDTQSRLLVKPLLLDFNLKKDNVRPWRFDRAGRTVLYLKHSSLETCIRKADFGLEFKIGKEKTAVTFKGASFEIDNEVFDSKLVPLVTELCALVEVAKNQVNNGLKSGAIFELSSLIAAHSTELKSVLKELVQSALQKTEQILTAYFGKNSVSLHPVQFKASDFVKNSSIRTLEEAVLPKDSAADEYAYGETIRYLFQLFLIALLFFVILAIFNSPIPKDPLIHAKFLVPPKSLTHE